MKLLKTMLLKMTELYLLLCIIIFKHVTYKLIKACATTNTQGGFLHFHARQFVGSCDNSSCDMLVLALLAILTLQCVTSQELDIVYNRAVRQGDSWTLHYIVNTNGSSIQVSAAPNCC